MPEYAREALIQRMERMGLLDRVSQDIRVLFHKRLMFVPEERNAPNIWVERPLRVGAVLLGFLILPASSSEERNRAYGHWLDMVCQNIAQELCSPQSQAGDILPAKVLRAAQIIRDEFTEKTSLSDVAREVDLSRERLSRLFHETLGITFSDYMNQVRLGHARERLSHSNESITGIAYSSGFQSLSQFNRRFKSAEGMTPSEYRRLRASAVIDAP